MEYIFERRNGGWWLKINQPSQLFDYYEKTDAKWSQAFHDLIHSKEFGKGMHHATDTVFAIGFYGANRKMNPIQAVLGFRGTVFENQLDALLKYGEIYINKNGGYYFKYNDEPCEQFVRRKEFVFPEFKESEIRIKKFPGGVHFYAYIGDMQVKDGDTIKWNTYEEAYLNASKLMADT